MTSEDSSAAPLRTLAARMTQAGQWPWHQHGWDQLFYAAEGVATVIAAEGRWVVPPRRGVWLPAGASHRVLSPGPLALRTIYFPPGRVPCDRLPRHCCVVGIPPLLRELILYLVESPAPVPATAERARLEAVLVDLLGELPQEPLRLPMPRDPRALRLAERLAGRPDDPRGLDELAAESGASSRTLQRCFARETGLGFRAWRQQLRLHRALELLAEGAAVTAVASQVGYESPSAFVSMFRRALGTTPGRYFDREHRPATAPGSERHLDAGGHSLVASGSPSGP